MWQDYAVGAIVAGAALYALWYWMPGALRRRLGAVRPALAKKPGCGSCSSCGGCGTGTGTGSAAAPPDGATKGDDQSHKPVWMAPDR